jgi:hypothetical protein
MIQPAFGIPNFYWMRVFFFMRKGMPIFFGIDRVAID